jgi:two-component system, response regulator PdtaR
MKPRVLLAEDEALIALPLQMLLEHAGCEVVATVATAAAAMEALRSAASSDALPEIALLDISLEGPADGIEAAHQIRALYGERVSLIFLTGRSDAAMRERAATAEPAAYLVKPCTSREITETITAVLDRREGRRLSVAGDPGSA